MVRAKRKESDFTEILKTVPLFASCTKKELSSVAAVAKDVHFSEGHVICREGDTGIGLHVVVEGETKVQIGGRTKRRLGPGAFFGEIALLDGGPRTATVIAETPVRTISIVAWDFRTALKANTTLTLKLLEEVCRRARSANSAQND